MTERKLQRFVTLTNPTTLKTHTFKPGQVLPVWAAKVATNPKLFQRPRYQRPNEVQGDSGGIFVQDATQSAPVIEEPADEDLISQ